MWKLYALLAAVFAAATSILAKMGLKGVNSNLATAVRTIVVLVIAWGLVAARGQMSEVRSLSKQNLVFLVLSGIATGVSWLFYFKALEEGEVAQVASIDKLSIVFTIVFAILFLGESAEPKVIVGGVLIFVGGLLMIL